MYNNYSILAPVSNLKRSTMNETLKIARYPTGAIQFIIVCSDVIVRKSTSMRVWWRNEVVGYRVAHMVRVRGLPIATSVYPQDRHLPSIASMHSSPEGKPAALITFGISCARYGQAKIG
jgi:hypothetical protein